MTRAALSLEQPSDGQIRVSQARDGIDGIASGRQFGGGGSVLPKSHAARAD